MTKNIAVLPASNEIEFKVDNRVEIIKIQPIAMQLLRYMIEKKGEVCTSEELIHDIWDGNALVGKASLRRVIYKLRKTLGAYCDKDLIVTVPKTGYRLNVFSDVEEDRRRHIRPHSFVTLCAAVIILLVIVKISFPGILHQIVHRISH